MKVVGSIPTSPTCKRYEGSWFPSASPELSRRSSGCVVQVVFLRNRAVGVNCPARISGKASLLWVVLDTAEGTEHERRSQVPKKLR